MRLYQGARARETDRQAGRQAGREGMGVGWGEKQTDRRRKAKMFKSVI